VRGKSISMSGIKGRPLQTHIVVPTMMHSGTHLLRYVILNGYVKNKNEDCFFNGDSGRIMTTFHVHSHTDQYKDLLNKNPVFTCLRHPLRMIQSYRRREGPGVGLSQKIQHFHAGWKWMMEQLPEKALFVHIDSDKRDAQVDAMSEALNLPLIKDWRVNEFSGSVHGTHNVGINGSDPEVKQEYIDYYYETLNGSKTAI